MIKVDEDRLIQELIDTASGFSSSRKDFLRKEYNSYATLNKALVLNNRRIIKGIEELIRRNPIMTDVLDKYSYDSYWDFIDKIDAEQDLIKSIASHYCKFMKQIRFKNAYFFDKVRKYSEKDFKDIIISYFATYGDKHYHLVKKYFDENRINIGSSLLDEAAGFFASIIWLNSGYIYSLYSTYDSVSAASVVHEFGHAIDAEMFLFPQQKKLPLFSDILLEVPSTAFEMGFYEYLKDQRIDVDGGYVLRHNRKSNLLDFFRELRKSLNTQDLDVNEMGVAVDENGQIYDFRADILYGLGYYFALHFNEIRKSSNTEFLKTLNDVITTRKESTLTQSIDKMGFNREDFINGRYIKPQIKEDYMVLKKRYKLD